MKTASFNFALTLLCAFGGGYLLAGYLSIAPRPNNTVVEPVRPEAVIAPVPAASYSAQASSSPGFRRLPQPLASIRTAEPAKPLLVAKGAYRNKSYRELLATSLNRNKALAMLNAPALSEPEVVKFLTLLGMIRDGWSLSQNSGHNNFYAMRQHLINVWPYYFDIIMAAECTYCGNHFEMIEKLAKEAHSAPEVALWMAPIHARYLALANELAPLSPHTSTDLAATFAQLGYAGDSRSRRFISQYLQEDKKTLAQWNPKQAVQALLKIKPANWRQGERKRTIKYWQQRVLNGAVDVELSIALATSGHRPALRWIIWLLDKKAPYLHKYVRRDIRPILQSAMLEHSNFDLGDFNNWSAFYSQHWQDIHWNKQEKQWLLGPSSATDHR